jgi:hypothetical protein
VAANRYRADARFTTDLDLLVGQDDHLAAVVREAGYRVTEVADPGEPPHLLIARNAATRVDILPAVVEYQLRALERGIDGFLTAEDVIIHKLIAWRARDRDDIRSILEAEVPLDQTYIASWAQAWEVEDRWETATSG